MSKRGPYPESVPFESLIRGIEDVEAGRLRQITIEEAIEDALDIAAADKALAAIEAGAPTVPIGELLRELAEEAEAQDDEAPGRMFTKAERYDALMETTDKEEYAA